MNRSRKTLDRWKKDKGLPIHNVSDSLGNAVFAYTHELDAWWTEQRGKSKPAEPLVLPSATKFYLNPFAARWVAIAGVLALVCISGAVALMVMWGLKSPLQPRPDSATEQLYWKARTDWALRTPDSLRRAREELETVVSREPDDADAHAALADVYLLMPEFSVIPQTSAFAQAEIEDNTALAIDPNDVGGNRAKGFIAYWWHHDNANAGRYFRQAIAHAPNDAQTHLWYGNALMNNGEISAGLIELENAHRLIPESPSIEADYAFAKWETASDREAASMLESIAIRAPKLSTSYSYLAIIAFSRREWGSYLRFAETAAQIRGDRASIRQIAEQKAGYARDGGRGLLAEISDEAPTPTAHIQDATVFPAIAAVVSGQTGRVLDLLSRAEAGGEMWAAPPWVRAMLAPARKDPRAAVRLDHLFARGTAKQHLAQ